VLREQEDGGGRTIAHRTSRYSTVPEATRALPSPHAWEVQALGHGTGGHDHRVGSNGVGIGEYLERGGGGEIDLVDSLGQNLGAEAEGLAAAPIHELRWGSLGSSRP
jgi:hypothetical protein